MDQIVKWFGKKTLEKRHARVRDFWGGEERYIVSVTSTESAYRQHPDEEAMLEMAPENLRAQAELPGCNLPAFFADFGPISTARYWGGKVRRDEESENIYIEPRVDSIEEALRLERRPVDDPQMDAARGVRLYRKLSERLQTDQLWLRTPDVQGPLNTAGLIVNQTQMLMGAHTEPERLRRFLDEITEFLIDYVRFCAESTDGKVCGFIWPYTFFPVDLGISLTEDLMPLLSPGMYRQFGLPCLERLAEEFGGLHIHCCGDWGRHAPTLAESGLPVRAVEFHHPFTTIDELECLAPDAVFVPYLAVDQQDEFENLPGFYEHLLETTGEDHRYWFAFPEDSEEAVEFARRHGFE
jgi:hypothetical protein